MIRRLNSSLSFAYPFLGLFFQAALNMLPAGLDGTLQRRIDGEMQAEATFFSVGPHNTPAF